MAALRLISDDERRARIAVRHGLHPRHRYPDALSAATAMTALHATEPPTVHLSLQARVRGVSVVDIEDALYTERSLVKQLAMRRTLFAFPRDLLPAALGSASARVAGTEFRRLAGDVERSGVSSDGSAWVEDAVAAIVDHLGDLSELDAAAVRAAVPSAVAKIQQGSGRWTQEAHVTPRLLTLAGARGAIVRGRNGGNWRISKPQWTSMSAWLGESLTSITPESGYAEIVRRWLWTFGPGTEADLVWWLGSTKAAVRAALAQVEAEAVGLESGETGWVLPGDDAPIAVGPWAALLPVLDPTTMGWRQREFYLDPSDVPYLFDSNGNGGTTAWWCGRIVGCWVQDADARVRVVPRHELAADASEALGEAAEQLTAWLDGVVVNSVYASQQMRGERMP